ncbi:hypothetical protein IFM89_039217 [Coptis chinensis]|uniref:Protein kinase domain-containing protein n=1 Tax=Coptis chinensis TaxID=261450 RepID=A0A835HXW7_9MAGN|nr:hypothetical protein IFM89_039217 [Coptis chinensis]
MYCGQEYINRVASNHGFSSMYYKVQPQNLSPPWRNDDKDGHYVFAIGDNLTHRYRIMSKMGEGTFGRVLECWDNEKKELVAIKIVRSIHKYREAALIEIDVLQKLCKYDVGGTRCVQIQNWFDYRNHICIVFEKLGPSLYDFLRKNSYRSFPIDLVRELGRQLLEFVAFMHDLRLIHTDLKPENILLVSSEYVRVPDYKFLSRSTKDGYYFKNLPKSSTIKLIDFGSTTFEHQDHSYVVSTRHYRAPEVILGLGWNYACDLWSVGCILIELCSASNDAWLRGLRLEDLLFGWDNVILTYDSFELGDAISLPGFIPTFFALLRGEALFQTRENLEHLAMMERVLGPLPQNMVTRADRRAEKYFRRGARLDWPEGATSRESMRAVWKLPRLQDQDCYDLRYVVREFGFGAFDVGVVEQNPWMHRRTINVIEKEYKERKGAPSVSGCNERMFQSSSAKLPTSARPPIPARSTSTTPVPSCSCFKYRT